MEYEDQLRGLMASALTGDAAAYKGVLLALTKQLRPYYVSSLLRYGRSSAEAEDLVQEALIAIHSRKHTYDPARPLMPWVYGIARYKLVDYLRRRKNAPEVSLQDIGDVGADVHSGIEDGLDVESLLARLPERMRTAVRLIKLEGASVSEAAARAGASESAVRVHAHRGIKAMMARLKGG